jgi:hypothetical protein
LFGVFTEKLVAPLPCKSTLKHIVYLPLGITGELGMPKIDFRNSPSNSPARELVLRARLPTPPRAQPKKTAALTHSRLPSPPRAPPRRTTAPAFASTSSKARQKSKVGTKEKEHKPAIRKEASREIKSEASATKPGAPPRRLQLLLTRVSLLRQKPHRRGLRRLRRLLNQGSPPRRKPRRSGLRR